MYDDYDLKPPKKIIDHMENSSKKARDCIKRAYQFAKDAHEGQKRYSGEPYFIHPIETAINLADIGVGSKTIAAGLLHDTIEDAGSDPDIIEEEFGEDVLFMVRGVTKLGKIRYQGMKRHIESLRKLFVATSQDIRVLIIKLADRLHNMETLEYVPDHKQERIAKETMEVYAPIAHRLGMGKLYGNLQDLAFPYIHPEEYKKVKELSEEKYEESVRNLEKIHSQLKDALEEEGINHIDIGYRLKHLYSLYQKLKRKDMDIDRIYDIAALRVITETESDCYRVLGIIHGIWQPLPGRIKDYIAFPKPNGYQSIHTTIFTGEGGIAEIQIRTKKMHFEAEYGIASHAHYKGDMSEEEATENMEWFQKLLSSFTEVSEEEESQQEQPFIDQDIPEWIQEMAEAQKEVSGPQEFMQNLRSDFFENRIFVFTPKGDVIDLPVGSSPIDFAYQIHSDIGDHIAGAKVNNKLVSLNTKLKNGDIVKVLTDESNEPKREWLEQTKTTAAKRRIRAALKDTQQPS